VYVEKLESPHAVRMASRIGTRVTLYSSSVGKAYLSTQSPAERDALLQGIAFARFTPNTIVERQALDAELDATRMRGYAEDREENEAQIFCYGSAIVGANGATLGCVSVSIPLFRKSATPLETYIAPLKEACRAIAERMSPGTRYRDVVPRVRCAAAARFAMSDGRRGSVCGQCVASCARRAARLLKLN
jgi:IclR family KDG regulon transcriptional repressor